MRKCQQKLGQHLNLFFAKRHSITEFRNQNLDESQISKTKLLFLKEISTQIWDSKRWLNLRKFFYVGSNFLKNVSAKSIGIGAEIVS